MKLLIDDGHLEVIKKLYDLYPLDGVTTNPTLLSRVGKPPMEVLKEIRAFLPQGAQLHAQLISQSAPEMVHEAKHMVKELGSDLFVKIPCTDQGIKAMMVISKLGINITATACYSPAQGLMAAKAGASYVAPYVNRLDNMGADGVDIALQISHLFDTFGYNCQVIGASFKNVGQVLALAQGGVPAITASGDVLQAMVHHPATTAAVADFTKDFYSLCGDGHTMLTQK